MNEKRTCSIHVNQTTFLSSFHYHFGLYFPIRKVEPPKLTTNGSLLSLIVRWLNCKMFLKNRLTKILNSEDDMLMNKSIAVTRCLWEPQLNNPNGHYSSLWTCLIYGFPNFFFKKKKPVSLSSLAVLSYNQEQYLRYKPIFPICLPTPTCRFHSQADWSVPVHL